MMGKDSLNGRSMSLFSYIKGPLTEVYEDVVVVEAGNIGWNIHVPLSMTQTALLSRNCGPGRNLQMPSICL